MSTRGVAVHTARGGPQQPALSQPPILPMLARLGPNKLKAALRARNSYVPLGLWASSCSTQVTELLAHSGLDWLCVDMEHAPNELPDVLAHLQCSQLGGCEPVVRLPSVDGVLTKRLLDAGARTLMYPCVESGDEAAAAVAATRYPPAGTRGVMITARMCGYAADPPSLKEYYATAEQNLCVLVQVESPAAVEAIPEMARTGIDGVFVGPSDLAAAIGRIGEPAHPEVQALVRRAHELCAASNVACGSIAGSADGVRQLREYGANFLALGTDMMLLQNALQARLDEVRI